MPHLARARRHAARFPRRFWILAAGEAVQALGVGLFLPYTAIYLTETIGLSHLAAGALLALFAVVGLGASPAGGLLSDRIGRRPVMLAGLAAAGGAAIAFGLVSSLAALAALICLWALAESAYGPAAQAYAADVVEPRLRTEAYGLLRIASNAAIAAGPPLGALVVWLGSLRLTFVLSGCAYLVYVLLAWRGLPESRHAPPAHEQPARLRDAARDRALVLLVAGIAVTGYLGAQYEDVFGAFLHEERGIAVATWGAIFGLNPLLVAVFQYPVARWAARRPPLPVLAAGVVLYGVAFALLLPLRGLGGLALATVILTAGEMLVSPVSTALVADLAPERLRGTYQGALGLAWQGPQGPALVLGLWLVGAGHGDVMLVAALPLALGGSLAFAALRRTAQTAGAASRYQPSEVASVVPGASEAARSRSAPSQPARSR